MKRRRPETSTHADTSRDIGLLYPGCADALVMAPQCLCSPFACKLAPQAGLYTPLRTRADVCRRDCAVIGA